MPLSVYAINTIFFLASLALLSAVVPNTANAANDANVSVCASGCDYSLIQDAINASNTSGPRTSVVVVHPGVYTETLVIPSGITVVSQLGAEKTILTPPNLVPNDSNFPYVIHGTLDGFTVDMENICAKKATVLVTGRGRLSNSIIQNNSCGIGVYMDIYADIGADNIIQNNKGGGIFAKFLGRIHNNRILNNGNGKGKGAGIYVVERSNNITIFRNIIAGNDADIGGGIFTKGGVNIISNVISGNNARSAAGIAVPSRKRTLIINNTITNNKLEYPVTDTENTRHVGGVLGGNYGIFYLMNNIIVGNDGRDIYDYSYGATMHHNIYSSLYNRYQDDGADNQPVGRRDYDYFGNIKIDPVDISAIFVNYKKNDFHIPQTSIAIDAGSSWYESQIYFLDTSILETDIDGIIRPQDGDKLGKLADSDIDIGAYEYRESLELTYNLPSTIICKTDDDVFFNPEINDGTEINLSAQYYIRSSDKTEIQVLENNANLCDNESGDYVVSIQFSDAKNTRQDLDVDYPVTIQIIPPSIQVLMPLDQPSYQIQMGSYLPISLKTDSLPKGNSSISWSINGGAWETTETDEFGIPWYFFSGDGGALIEFAVAGSEVLDSLNIDVEILPAPLTLIAPRQNGVYRRASTLPILVLLPMDLSGFVEKIEYKLYVSDDLVYSEVIGGIAESRRMSKYSLDLSKNVQPKIPIRVALEIDDTVITEIQAEIYLE